MRIVDGSQAAKMLDSPPRTAEPGAFDCHSAAEVCGDSLALAARRD
jgi:hypothetical protein